MIRAGPLADTRVPVWFSLSCASNARPSEPLRMSCSRLPKGYSSSVLRSVRDQFHTANSHRTPTDEADPARQSPTKSMSEMSPHPTQLFGESSKQFLYCHSQLSISTEQY